MHSTSQHTLVIDGRFAVGLVWRPLVAGGALPGVALQRAKEEKARMYVHDGTSAVVGLAQLARRQLPSGTVFALASMAARAYPVGEVIFALRVGGHWWVGAASAGLPIADALVADGKQVRAALEEQRERRPAALTYCDPELGVADAQPLHIEQLQPLQRPESALRQVAAKLPAVAYLAALVLIGFAGYTLAWPRYKARYLPTQLQAAPPVDAVAEWTAAQAAWVRGVKAATGSDLVPLKRAIFGLPLAVGGWQLVGLSCVLADAWQCRVHYQRPTGMDSDSTNGTFERERPREWQVAWKGAADLEASFDVAGTVTTAFVPGVHAHPLSAYQVDTYSEFQALSKPFTKVEVPQMVRVSFPAPKDREGKPIARPPAEALPEIFRAQVLVEGPLRNIELAESIQAPVFWREVTTVRGKADQPGLHRSEFHTSMKGEIYARTR